MMERFHGSVQAGISHNSESSKRFQKSLKISKRKLFEKGFDMVQFPLAFQFFNKFSIMIPCFTPSGPAPRASSTPFFGDLLCGIQPEWFCY